MDPFSVIGLIGLIELCSMTADPLPDPWLELELDKVGLTTYDLKNLTYDEINALATAIVQWTPDQTPVQWDSSRDDFHSPCWQRARLNDTERSLAQQREFSADYAELGPLFVSTPPIANSIGLEVGFRSTDEEAKTVQRTSIGFYLRSDHLLNRRYDIKVDVA